MLLDVVVMKYAVRHIVQAVARTSTHGNGPHRVRLNVTKFERQWLPPRGRREWWEAEVLPLLAAVARHGRLELLWSTDAHWEFTELPKRHDPEGLFFGSPLRWVDAPITRGAYVMDGHSDWRARRLSWLAGITDRRYLELRRFVNATPGSKRFLNQLLDAAHLWSAEHAGASHFVTCDGPLIRAARHGGRFAPRVAVVRPSELGAELMGLGLLGGKDLWADMIRKIGSPRRSAVAPLEDLADGGDILERQGFYDR